MRPDLTLARRGWPGVPADTFEERVRCCVLAAVEAEANGEAVVLAECRHRLAELIPRQQLGQTA